MRSGRSDRGTCARPQADPLHTYPLADAQRPLEEQNAHPAWVQSFHELQIWPHAPADSVPPATRARRSLAALAPVAAATATTMASARPAAHLPNEAIVVLRGSGGRMPVDPLFMRSAASPRGHEASASSRIRCDEHIRAAHTSYGADIAALCVPRPYCFHIYRRGIHPLSGGAIVDPQTGLFSRRLEVMPRPSR